MESKAVFLLFLVVGYEILLISGLTIFPPYKEDMSVCEMNSEGREVVTARKNRIKNCKVTCEYSGKVLETYNSPDGQDCCDIGIKSTGNCKNGYCRLSLSGMLTLM